MRKDFSFLGLVPCVLFSMLSAGTGFSQLIWERTYGGAAGEWGYSVQQTTDEGYIVAGVTGSFGNNVQVYLIKTDSLGDTLWTRNYGGTADEYGRCVQQTTDGGYIVAGYTTSFGNGIQIYLIKTDSLGDTLWTKNYGAGEGRSVQQTQDGGYIVAGSTGWDVLLIKADSLGDTLWTRNYGGTNLEYGYSVQQTLDDGYIIAGGAAYSHSYDPDYLVDFDSIYLIKTDSLGDTLWTKTYDSCEGRSVQQTLDGGYIAAGYDYYQVYLMKTDSLGDTLWTRNYGGTNLEFGYSVQQTEDRGYIVAGYSLYPDHYSQFYLVKTDSLGDTLWTGTYGGTEHYSDGYSVRQTQDGGYIVAGFSTAFTLGCVYVVKTDSLGDTLWTKNYGGTNFECGYSIQQTLDGGYIITGYTFSFGNDDQVYLIKTDEDGNSGIEEDNYFGQIPYTSRPLVFPNPFSSFTTVIGYEKERFILYDISGTRVGIYLGGRIGFGLSTGVYFIIPIDQRLKPIRIVKVR